MFDDEELVIIAGHTRYKALKALGYEEVQCLICDGLTEEQKKKYRYLDKIKPKTGEHYKIPKRNLLLKPKTKSKTVMF